MVDGSTSVYKDHESFISGSKGFDITVLENYGRTGLGFKNYGITVFAVRELRWMLLYF
jgi:hypothetical protein